ncbi:MAG TPA: hypothetical protein VFE14_11555, partial [Micromonosporaceae bacterium]|nr:hypothetical protein [Micromonosporaceae bacterium]
TTLELDASATRTPAARPAAPTRTSELSPPPGEHSAATTAVTIRRLAMARQRDRSADERARR